MFLAFGSARKPKFSRDQVAELYRRTGALVLRRCQMLLDDKAEAEDVVQEVFIRVMLYGSSVQEEKIPLSWLYRTAERCCFTRLKKRKREPPEKTDEFSNTLAVPDGQEQREALELVLRFFHRLDDQLKQVALLHYVDGLSQERIAKELGWSRRTVGKKIKKLRQRGKRLQKSSHFPMPRRSRSN